MRIISSSSQTAFLAAWISLFLTASVSAQTFGDVGERPLGMGTAFVAVADDATAIYWNPAGVASVFAFDAHAEVGSWRMPGSSTLRTGLIGAAMPALGIGYYRTRTGVQAAGSRKTEGSGGVRVSQDGTRNFGVTLVQTLVNTLVVGTTLRATSGWGSTAFELDAGALASAGAVRVGVSARNLRQALGVARQARAGVAFAPRSTPSGVNGPYTIAFDFDLTTRIQGAARRREAAIGGEKWWAHGLFATRVGTRWSVVDEAEPALSGGMTIRLPGSVLVEGHLTGARGSARDGWGLGLRYAF